MDDPDVNRILILREDEQKDLLSSLWLTIAGVSCWLTSSEHFYKTDPLQGSNTHPRPGPEEAGEFRALVDVVRRSQSYSTAGRPTDLQLLPPKDSVLAVVRARQRFDGVNLLLGL